MTDVVTKFVIRQFTQESRPQWFAEAMTIRNVVFVGEQAVPPEEEHDSYDETALHWLAFTADTETPVATARMLPYQEACQMRPVAKVGRVAVIKQYRSTGLGRLLMEKIIADAIEEGFEQMILDSQTRVLPFYQKLGFTAEGDEFLDANIPHFRMRKML